MRAITTQQNLSKALSLLSAVRPELVRLRTDGEHLVLQAQAIDGGLYLTIQVPAAVVEAGEAYASAQELKGAVKPVKAVYAIEIFFTKEGDLAIKTGPVTQILTAPCLVTTGGCHQAAAPRGG